MWLCHFQKVPIAKSRLQQPITGQGPGALAAVRRPAGLLCDVEARNVL